MRRLLALALLAPLLPAPAHAEPPLRSAVVAIPLEVVSPVGGAGCFYRRRPLPGALVVLGSLLSGGLLIHAAAHHDRDATIAGAVAYGLMRTIGIAAAARPDSPPRPAAHAFDPGPSFGAQPRWAFGLSHGLSF